MVSMVVPCIIGIIITPIMMNPSNHKNFYHFGDWFMNTSVLLWKIIVNTTHSSAIMHLVYLECIITICSVVVGLIDANANDGNVQAITNRIGLITKYLSSFLLS